MRALLVTAELLREMKSALQGANREDLAKALSAADKSTLSSSDAASLLGVSSPTTVKNWLENGSFPGAFKTEGGHWRFPLVDVLKAKERMEGLRAKNASRDLAPPDSDEVPEPPLL